MGRPCAPENLDITEKNSGFTAIAEPRNDAIIKQPA